MSNTVKENLDGEYYINVLEKIHTLLKPENYLEVGTHEGNSLRLSRCASIAVDPVVFARSAEHTGHNEQTRASSVSDGQRRFFPRFQPATDTGEAHKLRIS
ncbi:MAG: hypothetical protein WDN49_20310 [Acetobacteraceae bacterium]